MKITGFLQQHRVLIVGSALLLMLLLSTGCIRQGVYHQVEPGQTLYRISKTYDIDEAYLARINGIPNPTQLRVGTRIFIPGATSKKYVPATVPGYLPSGTKVTTTRPIPRPAPTATASPAPKPAQTKPSPPAQVEPTPAPKVAAKSAAVPVKLQWHLRGKILRSYGDAGKGGGKGVEISAREGTQVKAAAAGKVIYSGDGVQGFGQLTILQHENDIFTVYGYNQKTYVRQGQFVSQGQKIASSGRPPSGESGRLHFEVRVGKVAVNPILYLP